MVEPAEQEATAAIATTHRTADINDLNIRLLGTERG
jgi:hypothetical protein